MDPNPIPVAAGTVHCCVCGDSVPFADAVMQKQQARKVCRSVDCRRLLEQEAHMPPAMFRAQLAFQRQRIQDFREREAARQAHRERIITAEDGENQAIADALLAQESNPDGITLVAIPMGRHQLEPQADSRRERYRTHIETILVDALACASVEELPRDQHYDARERRLQTDEKLAQQPRLQQFCDDLCAQCKGGCCAAGADEAYLTPVSVRRVLDANPGMSGDELVQRYLDYLPQQSMAYGCINQTATGCALPREWRSDVCNGYFCTELKALQQAWETKEPQRLLAIQRAHHNWNRFEADDPNPVVAVVWVGDAGVEAIDPIPTMPDVAEVKS